MENYSKKVKFPLNRSWAAVNWSNRGMRSLLRSSALEAPKKRVHRRSQRTRNSLLIGDSTQNEKKREKTPQIEFEMPADVTESVFNRLIAARTIKLTTLTTFPFVGWIIHHEAGSAKFSTSPLPVLCFYYANWSSLKIHQFSLESITSTNSFFSSSMNSCWNHLL